MDSHDPLNYRAYFFVLVFVTSLFTTGCDKTVTTGVERTSHAQADAIEAWSERNHRPHRFLFTQAAEFGASVAPTWITVVDYKIVLVTDLDGAPVDLNSPVFRSIDDLHRELSEILLGSQAMIASGFEDKYSGSISASFRKSTGVPLSFTWDSPSTIDDWVTWEILVFEFLDE